MRQYPEDLYHSSVVAVLPSDLLSVLSGSDSGMLSWLETDTADLVRQGWDSFVYDVLFEGHGKTGNYMTSAYRLVHLRFQWQRLSW